MRARVVVLALSWVPAVACGGPLDPPGASCGVDADCAAGLSCLALANAPGPDCKTIAKACTKPCRVDADCAAVGPEFECVPACSGSGTCAHLRTSQ